MCKKVRAFVQRILNIYARHRLMSNSRRDVEFVELVPTARSLQIAYKRQMLNSSYLRPGLDTSPRPWQFPIPRDPRAKNYSRSERREAR